MPGKPWVAFWQIAQCPFKNVKIFSEASTAFNKIYQLIYTIDVYRYEVFTHHRFCERVPLTYRKQTMLLSYDSQVNIALGSCEMLSQSLLLFFSQIVFIYNFILCYTGCGLPSALSIQNSSREAKHAYFCCCKLSLRISVKQKHKRCCKILQPWSCDSEVCLTTWNANSAVYLHYTVWSQLT